MMAVGVVRRSSSSRPRFRALLLAVWMMLALMAVSFNMAMSTEADASLEVLKPKSSSHSSSKASGAKSPSASTSSGSSNGPISASSIHTKRQLKAANLRKLGDNAKIRSAHAQFDATLARSRETLREIQSLEAGSKTADPLHVAPGKELNAVRYVQRVRVNVAMLNARYASVNNPLPFSAASSLAMKTPAQFKKMTSTRRRKGVQVPLRRFGQKPHVYPTAAGRSGSGASSKVTALKDKVTNSAAKDATRSKSKSVAVSKSGKRKSLLQLNSAQSPRSGAGGYVGKSGKTGGGSGTDASKSGKTGGGSGTDASKSGKTGGGSGTDASKSGKAGGTVGDDASKSGKTGGTGSDWVAPKQLRLATPEENAKCNNAPAGTITYWSATAAGQKVYKNTPGYKSSPGDMVMADGHIFNQGHPPPAMQFNPRTGKCFMPIVTVGAGGVTWPGRCPSRPGATNPAVDIQGRPWAPEQIHYDENDQICYGPQCPPSRDDNGNLLYPFNAWIANGRLTSTNFPSFVINGQSVNAYMRNQGDGSWCWANTAVEITEMAQQIQPTDAQGNKLPSSFKAPLSVSTLVHCVKNGGADGGSPIDALEWMKTHVLPFDNVKHSDLTCPPAVPVGQGTVKSYVTPIPTCDHGDCSGQNKYEDELAKQLGIMPILTYVDASNWLQYKPVTMAQNNNRFDGSLLQFPTAACSNNPDLGNHVVLIVGLVNDVRAGKKYWLALNSWGDTWGAPNYNVGSLSYTSNGYIYLEYGVNACGLANFPVAVDLA